MSAGYSAHREVSLSPCRKSANECDIRVTWHSKAWRFIGNGSNLAALLLRGCREMQPAPRFSAEREKRGKRFSVGGNGQSQAVSPRQQPELKYIIHNKMISDMICRDVGWHAEEIERHPKHSMYIKSIFHRQICWRDSPVLLSPPVAHLSLLVSKLLFKEKPKRKKPAHTTAY